MKDMFTNGMTWCLGRLGMGRYDPNWSKLQGKLHAICDIQQPQPSSKWHLYYA